VLSELSRGARALHPAVVFVVRIQTSGLALRHRRLGRRLTIRGSCCSSEGLSQGQLRRIRPNVYNHQGLFHVSFPLVKCVNR
jgi:hypothetical protein